MVGMRAVSQTNLLRSVDREAERMQRLKSKGRDDWNQLRERRGVAFSLESAQSVFQEHIKTPLERLAQTQRRLAPLRRVEDHLRATLVTCHSYASFVQR